MSSPVYPRFDAVVMAVNSTYIFPQGSPTSIGGFLAATTGTLTATTQSGTVIINAFPVTAGTYVPMPFRIGHNAVITLGGGASGTLAVA